MVFYNLPEYCHSSAASFLGDGLSSAGKFASTFLVILPLEEKDRAAMSHYSILLICSFLYYSHTKRTLKYILLVLKLRNT